MSEPTLRNPWSDEKPAPPFTLSPDEASPDEGWPYRLLHVPTMTSHEKKDGDVYGDTRKPRYNVLSYTWGRWRVDDGEFPTIEIHGVPWTIPCIDPGKAFNPTQFKNAIVQAAHGVQEDPCDWLWVDIACIPQERKPDPNDKGDAQNPGVKVDGLPDDEDLKRVGAEEVGRQVAIFKGAEESFVWLWGLSESTLQHNGSRPRVEDLEGYVLALGSGGFDLSLPDQLPLPEERAQIEQRFNYAANCLLELDTTSKSFQAWIHSIMNHVWCGSLWTLQEMVLRPDAWILLDDGLFEIDDGQKKTFPLRFSPKMMRDLPRTQAMTSNNSGKWSLSDIKFEIFLLGSLLGSSNGMMSQKWERIKEVETTLRAWLILEAENSLPSVTNIQKELESTLELMRKRGMDALHISFPHTAYSAAQHRVVGEDRPLDRVYGIVQTYGITCDPYPQGYTPEERLTALQDDFGKKLVSKMPVLSQLFIHSLDAENNKAQHPRRSWLITTKCKVDDHWWSSFESGHNIINLFDSFRPIEDAGSLFLEFKGRAWDLDPFVQPPSPSKPGIRDRLLKPGQNPVFYNGLMLDSHVSITALKKKEPINYFSSFEELGGAVDKLRSYYCKDSGTTTGPTDLRVASLGCSFRDDLALPDVYHVALVLAPSKQARNYGTTGQEVWSRIGLMRWVERYPPPAGHLLKKHPDLPEPREFSCLID